MQFVIHPIGPIEERPEREVETALVVGYAPGLHKVVTIAQLLRMRRARLFGNAEAHAVQLVRNTVHERHVLRGCRRVTEAVAQVEPEAPDSSRGPCQP